MTTNFTSATIEVEELIEKRKQINKKIATVSSSGKVTGKKKGTVKITVTMKIKDGAKKTLTTKVTVK